MPQADELAGGRLRVGLDMFYYIVFAAVAVRLVTQVATQNFRPWLQAALLAAFLLLSLLQPVLALAAAVASLFSSMPIVFRDRASRALIENAGTRMEWSKEKPECFS